MTAGPALATLALDLDDWDICPDAFGNLALANPPYSTAQDVASAIKTFKGDCYYDQTIGIDYFGTILGHTPPLAVFLEAIQNAALSVPSVISATCVITSVTGRAITGYVAFTDSAGNSGTVAL